MSSLPGPKEFSAERSCDHAGRLRALRQRSEDDEWVERRRTVLGDALAKLGAETSEIRLPADGPGADPGLPAASDDVHIVGILPGASPDRFLIVAPYGASLQDVGQRGLPGMETRRSDTDDDASSVAVSMIVELTRALAARSRLFTVMVLLVDEANWPEGGSRRLAHVLEADGLFAHIRLAVFFDQIGAEGLVIPRDLRSHPVHQDVFFETARHLGYVETFPPDAPFATLDGSHRAFVDRGLRQVVAISGDRARASMRALEDGSGADSRGQRGTCSRSSVQAVGDVALEALERIGTRLARVDRFRAFPLQDPISGGGGPPGGSEREGEDEDAPAGSRQGALGD